MFDEACPLHIGSLSPDEVDLCSNPRDRINITVGICPESQAFLIHADLLCHFSDYFKAALHGGRFLEALTREFHIPEVDPVSFARWVDWLYSCAVCKWWPIYDRNHVCADEDVWCSSAAEEAFILGDRFQSLRYCQFALGHFIQHVHLVEAEELRYLFWAVAGRRGMNRFIRGWLAWLRYKGLDQAEDWGTGSCSRLFRGIGGWTCLDPRRYPVIHWYEGCGKNRSVRCKHFRLLVRPQRKLWFEGTSITDYYPYTQQVYSTPSWARRLYRRLKSR
ncbi:hypothetical protein B0T25DRAFT_515483 [Lasiosphaeria hispida]|uniref:BTB domain-containing protein n=1 Tax=Lasiosphaeria hispida TaxID=260671 RepID=A0AAJ0HRG4_9PEZI|nr:hypothetical protein B0T25DRAFT_515483 [Lasiosphaeria hispida]